MTLRQRGYEVLELRMALAWHVLVCAVAHGTLADKLLRRLIGEDIDLLLDLPPQLSRVPAGIAGTMVE